MPIQPDQSEQKSPAKLSNGPLCGENSRSHPRSLFSGLRSRKVPGDLSSFRDPSRDPLPILFGIGWPLLVAGQLADYLSTLAALGAGGIEANPFISAGLKGQSGKTPCASWGMGAAPLRPAIPRAPISL